MESQKIHIQGIIFLAHPWSMYQSWGPWGFLLSTFHLLAFFLSLPRSGSLSWTNFCWFWIVKAWLEKPPKFEYEMHPEKLHLSATYISLPNGTQGYTLAFLKVGLASNRNSSHLPWNDLHRRSLRLALWKRRNCFPKTILFRLLGSIGNFRTVSVQ